MIFDIIEANVKIEKLHPDVPTPQYATSFSTCFDLCFFPTSDSVKAYDKSNNEFTIPVSADSIVLHPGQRALLPTGLKFCIDDVPSREYSIRLHPRSGLSLKHGLILSNCEGVIDADYQEEVFAIIVNTSSESARIKKFDRICQGEVVQNMQARFTVVERVQKISERSGGFGSTGV